MDEKELVINGEKLTLLISSDEIHGRVNAIAKELRARMGEKIPVFLSVLNGSFIFASDLVRAYEGACNIKFVAYSSYCGANTSGEVKTLMGVSDEVKGRCVIVVEDIIDTGLTMAQMLEDLKRFEPKQVIVVSLFSKKARRTVDVQIDYSCFDIPDYFIVGYGLDYDQLYRNLPAIYVKE